MCIGTLCFSLYSVSCPNKTYAHNSCTCTTCRKNNCSDIKVFFCNLKTKPPFPVPSFFFIASDDKRLNHTGFTLVRQTIHDAMFQTCLVTTMQNQQHSHQPHWSGFYFTRNTFPTSPPPPAHHLHHDNYKWESCRAAAWHCNSFGKTR